MGIELLGEHFAPSATKQRVREPEEQSTVVLDNESKERALVGEVISTVALAGQLSREFNVSDHFDVMSVRDWREKVFGFSMP